MNKLITSILILVCVLGLVSCDTNANTSKNELLKDEIVKSITVTSFPEEYNRSFTGNNVERIVRKISNMQLNADFEEDPNVYTGMTWVISIVYENGETATVELFSDIFIRVDEGSWYKVSKRDGERLLSLLKSVPLVW